MGEAPEHDGLGEQLDPGSIKADGDLTTVDGGLTTVDVVQTVDIEGGVVVAPDTLTLAKVVVPTKYEDMDEDLVHEQAQAVVEELRKRGTCTSLALAKMVGLEKSTELNPLLSLLLEKNVLAKVADFPPVWALAPTFPLNPMYSVAVGVPEPQNPSAPGVSHFQPHQPVRQPYTPPTARVGRQPMTVITFPHIPPERTLPERARPIVTFPLIPPDPESTGPPVGVPAFPQQQQQTADYWHSLSQFSSGRNNNRNGGGAGGPHKPWKKQKNLTELQIRLLKELKERGPTRTLRLSKIVGLVTCRDVNPFIYDLKQRNLVVKVNSSPPVWQLNEPGLARQPFQGSDTVCDEDEDDLEMDGALPGSPPSSLQFYH